MFRRNEVEIPVKPRASVRPDRQGSDGGEGDIWRGESFGIDPSDWVSRPKIKNGPRRSEKGGQPTGKSPKEAEREGIRSGPEPSEEES